MILSIVRMLRTTGFVGFECFVPINNEIDAFFYVAANHAITKKMHFFLFVGDSFCPFLRYIYGD